MTVKNTNDAPTLANALKDQTVQEDAVFRFEIPANTFNDVDVNDSFTYSATLADGSALPSWLKFNSHLNTFFGVPTFAGGGTIAVKVTASDGTATVSDTFDLTVNNVNDAPTVANAIKNFSALKILILLSISFKPFSDVDVGTKLTYIATSNGSSLPMA